MKRGWILGISLFCEVVMFLGTCCLIKFLPISMGWKILIGVGGGIAMFLLGCGLIYWWWAPNNLFFTFVREGTAKVAVRAHRFRKAFIQFEGYTFSDEWNVVPDRAVRPRGKENLLGGLVCYGFWPLDDVFTYEFRWAGMADSGELEPHPKEQLDYIFVKDDVYGCEITKAEDKELMPLNIKLALTVKIINPYRALFVVENWYETMINRVRPYVRDFVTTATYAELIKDPQRIGTGVVERLEKEKILNELEGRYGVNIRKIEVNAIDPEERFREATMRNVLALREKEEIITKAMAEKARLETVAQGEKKRIDMVYSAVKEHGSLGKIIRTLEALEKSPEKGAKWIIPLPSMADLFPRALFRKRSSRSSPQRNQRRSNPNNQS